MRYCQCDRPALNERRPEFCRRCGVRHNPLAITSNEAMLEFQTRIASLPGVTAAGLIHAVKREQAGRDQFKLTYLGRDNDAEGMEEFADGLVYPYLSWLNDRRAGRLDIHPDLLDAAHHAALAHAALERRQRG